MGYYHELSEFERDVLKELCTIGTGNAATSLSEILSQPITIQVPSLDIISPEEMPENLGGAELEKVVVFAYMTGKYPSKFLIIFSVEEAKNIAGILSRQKVEGLDFYDSSQEMVKSVLLEIGNIIISSYVSAMSNMIGAPLIQTPPQIKYDILGSIVDEFCIESAEDTNELLLLKNEFVSKGREILFDIIFMPTEESFLSIISKLKGE